MPLDKATPEQERMLNGLLDAFRQLGPVESLDWFATYFDRDFTKAMAAHGHPVPWVDDLTREIQALVVKYRAKQG